MRSGERVTDSAGITCEYTRIEDLKEGDVVILGWRSIVKRVETRPGEDGYEARIVWRHDFASDPSREIADQWNRCGTLMPKEVVA